MCSHDVYGADEFVDAVGVATDEKEEDRILNSVKALYNTVDPDVSQL